MRTRFADPRVLQEFLTKGRRRKEQVCARLDDGTPPTVDSADDPEVTYTELTFADNSRSVESGIPASDTVQGLVAGSKEDYPYCRENR